MLQQANKWRFLFSCCLHHFDEPCVEFTLNLHWICVVIHITLSTNVVTWVYFSNLQRPIPQTTHAEMSGEHTQFKAMSDVFLETSLICSNKFCICCCFIFCCRKQCDTKPIKWTWRYGDQNKQKTLVSVSWFIIHWILCVAVSILCAQAVRPVRQYKRQNKQTAEEVKQQKQNFLLLKKFALSDAGDIRIGDVPDTAVVDGVTLTFSCKPRHLCERTSCLYGLYNFSLGIFMLLLRCAQVRTRDSRQNTNTVFH